MKNTQKLIMKTNLVLQILILLIYASKLCFSSESEINTNVARSDEALMVIVTLSGSMIAIDPQTSHLRWMQQFDPVLKTSQGNSNLNMSIFLPDPVSGSLYSMRQQESEDGDEKSYELEKMPHSIPDLALKSPFRSPEENILYTGRKSDTWFMINSKTGECKNILDFNHIEGSTGLMPMPKLHDVYIGRTQYDVCMANMNPTERRNEIWNVSMYQYNAFEMGEEITAKYEFIHIVSTSTGKLLTLMKQSGDVLWAKNDLNSPVVALFLMGKNGFLNIPFTSVDDSVFEALTQPVSVRKKTNKQLHETIYIGKNESENSVVYYAVPSFTDEKNSIIVKQVVGNTEDPALEPGHYDVKPQIKPEIPLITGQSTVRKIQNNSAAIFYNHDEKFSGPNVTFPITVGLITIITILISKFIFDKYSKYKKVINEDSQRSRSSVGSNLSEEFPPTIGKITFDPFDLIGKGSEGTSVYRGAFDNRTVAVKRLLVDCFGIADKEVRMLRESDNHENIIRYFCTEFDREFCYIAVELCTCTLHDYATNGNFAYLRDLIKPKEMLYQATRGLSHLHQLNIIHRDIKPQNILLSMPDSRNSVRALISDFGLCKKVEKGNASVSIRTNIAGTEGWIAPESLKNEKLSKSVDIFSLGCVYFYTLTNGVHPFGEPLTRQSNILSHNFNLNFDLPSAFDHEYEKILAHELINDMIKPQYRPTTDAVLKHPLFWSDSKMLDFMQVISDRIERLDTSDDPLWSLERNAKMIVRDDWKEKIEEEIVNDLGKQRTYHGISVRDLMRAIRNKKNHYNELTDEVKKLLGTIPIDYNKFWLTRFPHLPSHAFHVMHSCSKETAFNRFYIRYYTFTKPSYHFDKSLDNHELVELQKRLKIEIAAANSKKWFEQKQQNGGWSYVNGNKSNGKSRRGFYNFKTNSGHIERRGSNGSGGAKDCDE